MKEEFRKSETKEQYEEKEMPLQEICELRQEFKNNSGEVKSCKEVDFTENTGIETRTKVAEHEDEESFTKRCSRLF